MVHSVRGWTHNASDADCCDRWTRYLAVTRLRCAKTAKRIELLLWVETPRHRRNVVLDWGCRFLPLTRRGLRQITLATCSADRRSEFPRRHDHRRCYWADESVVRASVVRRQRCVVLMTTTCRRFRVITFSFSDRTTPVSHCSLVYSRIYCTSHGECFYFLCSFSTSRIVH